MDERQDLVRRIKDLVDIVDVVGSYVELSKRGTRYLGLCPFHAENDPSFTVNKQEQFFHCFGCKKSGDIFDFVMSMESVSFPEAMKMLGERCGIQVEKDPAWRRGGTGRTRTSDKGRLLKILEAASLYYERNLQSAVGAKARQYLTNRHFPPDAFHVFRLGFATDTWRGLLEALTNQGAQVRDLQRAGLAKQGRSGSPYDLFRNRLMIPIFDMQGRVVGFGGRVLDDSEPKYINSPETEIFQKNRLLYGLNRARRTITQERLAVVVEGYTDVLMAHQRGVTSAVATLGTALTHEHARVLRRMADRILLLFDGDNAGTLAAERGIEILLANDLDVVVVPLEKGTDPCDFFRANDAESFRRFTAGNGQDFFDFSLRNLTERHDIRTPGGRARIAREMFRLVAALGDPIRQDLVLHRTAEALDIREDLLRREFLKSRDSAGKAATADNAEGAGETASGSTAMAEEDLLLGLVKQPDLIDRFRADLELIALEGRPMRRIMELLLRTDTDGPLRPKELLLLLREDEESKNRLIALLTEARRTEPEELVSAALGFLASRSRDKRYREIRDRQKANRPGGTAGGQSPSDEELAELDRLLKEKHNQRDARF